MIIGYSRAGSPPTDSDFSSVKLLMGFEGSNASTGTPGMDDESPAAHGTAIGGSSFSNISTSQKKFGTSALHLTGNHIHFADSADWNLGSGHFTIEAFVYFTSISDYSFIVAQWNVAPDLGWVLYADPSSKLSWNVSTSGSDNLVDITGTTTITTGVWHHVAIDYDGSKYRVYLDGSMDGSSTTARTIHDSSLTLSIGAAENGGFGAACYMDELRITKGVARYSSDGGFTVPTSAYPRS